MGLTERHWFEDEEPELTEKQLEDFISDIKNSYQKGYEKGFSDGRQCMDFSQRESAPAQRVKLFDLWIWYCSACKTVVTEGDSFCRKCGKRIKWHD